MDLKVLNFWQTYDCILRIAGMEIDGSGGELHSHCDGLSACHWSSQMSSSSLSLSFSMSIALSCSLSLLCSLLHYTTTTNNSTTTTTNNNSSSRSSSKFITCHQLHDSCINSSKWWVSCISPLIGLEDQTMPVCTQVERPTQLPPNNISNLCNRTHYQALKCKQVFSF